MVQELGFEHEAAVIQCVVKYRRVSGQQWRKWAATSVMISSELFFYMLRCGGGVHNDDFHFLLDIVQIKQMYLRHRDNLTGESTKLEFSLWNTIYDSVGVLCLYRDNPRISCQLKDFSQYIFT